MVSEGASYVRPPHRNCEFRGRIGCHTRVQELQKLHKYKSGGVLGVN